MFKYAGGSRERKIREYQRVSILDAVWIFVDINVSKIQIFVW